MQMMSWPFEARDGQTPSASLSHDCHGSYIKPPVQGWVDLMWGLVVQTARVQEESFARSCCRWSRL